MTTSIDTVPSLVDATWLREHLQDPGVVVFEVSRDEDGAGYVKGHIPGARFVYWKSLAWDQGRRDFPRPEVLSQRLGAMGVSRSTRVVICGDPIQFGVYVYWCLKSSGHANVSVLDGGKHFWQEEGLPLSNKVAQGSLCSHECDPADWTSRASREDVLDAIRDGGADILDVRTPDEYEGRRVSPVTHPIDNGAQVKGRIPGAHHLYYAELLRPDGRFLAAEDLLEKYAGAGIALDRSVITYCRLGHRASLAWFCLHEIGGHPSVRVYDGSWTEWGSMVGMPVER